MVVDVAIEVEEMKNLQERHDAADHRSRTQAPHEGQDVQPAPLTRVA